MAFCSPFGYFLRLRLELVHGWVRVLDVVTGHIIVRRIHRVGEYVAFQLQISPSALNTAKRRVAIDTKVVPFGHALFL